jgi:hypothetical protein
MFHPGWDKGIIQESSPPVLFPIVAEAIQPGPRLPVLAVIFPLP